MVYPTIIFCDRCGRKIGFPNYPSDLRFDRTVGTWGTPSTGTIKKTLCHKCAKALDKFLKGDKNV